MRRSTAGKKEEACACDWIRLAYLCVEIHRCVLYASISRCAAPPACAAHIGPTPASRTRREHAFGYIADQTVHPSMSSLFVPFRRRRCNRLCRPKQWYDGFSDGDVCRQSAPSIVSVQASGTERLRCSAMTLYSHMPSGTESISRRCRQQSGSWLADIEQDGFS